MLRNWLAYLLGWLPREQSSPGSSTLAALQLYQQALDGLKGNPQSLLPALLARDQVEAALQQNRPLPIEHLQRLVALDGQLRELKVMQSPGSLSDWRQVTHPPDVAWWWFLDQRAEERENKSDLPWILLTGTLLTLTAPLALEIIRRLWDGAPDSISVFGTLLTLLVTGSPLFRQGQELAQRILRRISWLKPHLRAKAMAGIAALAFIIVLVGRLWLLPQLAVYYNNQGHATLHAGNLTAAQQSFQRAVALDPERVVPYQNLAGLYQRIGRPKEAITWYQKAIEHDLSFGPAYSGLGHVYNVQGEFIQAEQVLLAGLAHVDNMQDAALKTVARYQLLGDLGWSYFSRERLDRAQVVLEAAIALEGELVALGNPTGTEYRLAVPHYYLAQVYEQMGRPQDARQQWEESLRFLDQENWTDREWIDTALSRLKKLEGQK